MTRETPVLITGNSNKVRAFTTILGCELKNRSINLTEIQSTEVLKVVERKLLDAHEAVGEPVIVEDTGLHIGYINQFPGALIKDYYKCLKSEGIAMAHGTSPATAITIIGYHDGSQMHFYEGSVKGKIASIPAGKNGFGWDNIFIPDGHNKTFAEMTIVEKNKCSMRTIALIKLMKVLNPAKYKELEVKHFVNTYGVDITSNSSM